MSRKAPRQPIKCEECGRGYTFWAQPTHMNEVKFCCYCGGKQIKPEHNKTKRKTKTKNTAKVRKLWIDQQSLCYYCKIVTEIQQNKDGVCQDNTATLDHYIPGSKIYVMACFRCNNKKGNKLIHPVTGEKLPNEP